MKLKMEAEKMHNVFEAANRYRNEGLLKIDGNGITMRCHEYTGNALYAMHIPADAADTFEPGEFNSVGVRVEKIMDFLPKNSDDATLEIVEGAGKIYKLNLVIGSREYKIPLIDTDEVAGVPSQVPDLDHGIKVESSFDFIEDFIKDHKNITSSDNRGAYYISARDGMLYLWSRRDDYEIVDRIHWEDFDDYDIDWSKCNVPTDDSGDQLDIGYTPEEDHICNSVISAQYTDYMHVNDDVEIYIDNHFPMKIVERSDDGILKSWIIPPRIPNENDQMSMPDRVIKDRGVSG